MHRSARITLTTFGILEAAAALEHGIGEILQGSTDPGGVMILSWPDSPFFGIHGGEPAMTLIPNLLVSGILTVLLALALLVWSVWFVDHRRFGPGILLLSAALLLVGGGFGPPVLGFILGTAALLLRRPAKAPAGFRTWLGRQWGWLYAAGLAAWLLLFPGLNLISYGLGIAIPDAATYGVILSAFGFLLLALWSAGPRGWMQTA